MRNGAGDETCSTSRNVKMFELMRPKTAVFETASINVVLTFVNTEPLGEPCLCKLRDVCDLILPSI
jgi:hypothetical protein